MAVRTANLPLFKSGASFLIISTRKDTCSEEDLSLKSENHLCLDDATGLAAATNAPDTPRQQPSMHAHTNWQGGRRGDPAPSGGDETGPASSG